eukprot:00332.XXX_1855_200_1 [CDS] Oithona nana genome sequencing.
MEDSSFAPKVDDSERRRSGRQTQRKKYVDDVDLNLSEDENLLMDNLPPDSEPASKEASKPNSGTTTPKEPPTPASTDGKIPPDEASNELSQSGPNYAYVDPTAEDTMVVQLILASRMGTRELESDEEDENAFEVSREHLTKFIGKAPPTKSQLQEAIEKAATDAKNPKAEQNDKTMTKDDNETVKTEKNENPTKTTENDVKTDDVKIDDVKTDDVKAENDVTVEKKAETEEPKEPKEVPNDKETKPEPESTKMETEEEAIDPAPKVGPGAVPIKKKELSKTARMIEVEEYLVKFKNFSYLHCQWLTEEELHRGDKRISQKIKRFKQKREKSANVLEFCEDEHFNPDYVEVDRVLDASIHTDDDTGVVTKHFLVKWRSLPYEDCTWELESDVDPNKIKDYEKWKHPPAEDAVYKKRPRKHEWRKWDESPAYKNNNTLRPYQLEGVNWLLFSYYNGRNCLLADEMGLGKTIQSLTFLDAIFEYGIRGPFLVIAPLSTIPNW